MSLLIDTMVLLHGLHSAAGVVHEDPEISDRLWRSEQLIENAEYIAVSSITWFEARRLLTPDAADALAKWQGRIDIVPVDARVAARAASLIEAARSVKGIMCPRCLGHKTPVVCSVCGNQSSRQQKTRRAHRRDSGGRPSDQDALFVRRGHVRSRSIPRERSGSPIATPCADTVITRSVACAPRAEHGAR